ncbi:MAG: SPASM domain-containing protein [Clostridia bacterium]|nr:SPASM domain-containing protein [Clostridia bacterium]
MYKKVYVEITNVCNKACSFCKGTKRPPKFMSEDEFSFVLDKIKGKTEYVYFHLMGEPLLHPQIEKFISLAKQKGFKPAITTNGSLLAEKGEALIFAKPYKISVSLHSFEGEETGEFFYYVNNCISFCEKASKNGILTVLRLWNKGFDSGKNETVLRLIEEKFGELEMVSKGFKIADKFYLEFGERFSWPDINIKEITNNIYCYALKDQFGVLVDGTVVPCCLDSDGIINLGNIFTQNIEDILSSKRAEDMRCGFSQRKPSEELCKKCGFATRF